MTVIVFDGKTLAADKSASCGGVVQSVTKIQRHGDELLACTGNLSIGLELFDWYKRGALPSTYPPANRDEDKGASLIVVGAGGMVRKYESSPFPIEFNGAFSAFGSGAATALGAMHMGATAKQAVEAAIKWDAGCGLGIDTLELQP